MCVFVAVLHCVAAGYWIASSDQDAELGTTCRRLVLVEMRPGFFSFN